MDEAILIGTIEEAGSGSRTERRDAVANRARILEAAEKLFARRGVTAVSMADIAQAADVGKGTLYRNFANKAELCLALMDSQMTEFQNNMLSRMRQMTAEGKSNLEQLDHFLDMLVYFTDAHMPLLCEVQREGLLYGSDSALQLPHFWQHMTVSGLLRAAATNGELSSGLDTDYLADAILAPLKADIFQFQREVRGFSLERISAGLRLLVAGLRYVK
ncbi:MAG TPA: helix-turn-helix domain-containing protein [Anaerolineae bacterium]